MRTPNRRVAVIEPLENRRLLSVAPPVVGALSGRIVYTSAGHGFAAAGNLWRAGRPLTNAMVEDFGNQDQLLSYADYLLNAGATVVPMRPVGHQPNEVVLDNASPGVSYAGSWQSSTESIYFGNAADAVSYRFASTNAAETAVATYTPTLPAAGLYPVYTWVPSSANRTNQLYRVNHTGGAAEIRVDHRLVGRGWVYLGTYHFNAGSSGNVQISNRSDGSGGSVVIADAIRFGNGMGDINRGSGVSGRTREDEAALYWIERSLGQGAVRSDIITSSDDESANVSVPARFAAWMNSAAFGTALYLGYHSNASNGTARGAIGLTNADGGVGATPNQTFWADLVAREMTRDIAAMGASAFEFAIADTGNYVYDNPNFDYGEISANATSNEFDATILEVAFHDNPTDAALMRDPKFRDAVGRASTQATVKYFASLHGGSNAMAPGAPRSPRASSDAFGNLTLSWQPPIASAFNGDAASGYVVEVSGNGYGFAPLATIAGGASNSFVIPAAQRGADATYYRVRATNAGGRSEPSWVVGSRLANPGGPRVLLVNGFTRLERSQNPTQTTALTFDPPSAGSPVTFERVRARFSNSFDYVVQAGDAIEAFASLPVNFDAVDKSALVGVSASPLARYDAVIWLAGEQSSRDRTFTSAEQTLVSNYLAAGGRVFVSGSEVGYDLVGLGNGASFFTNTLRAGYVGDDAGTYAASGVAGSIFAGLSLAFDNGTQFYDVDFPDRLSASGGSSVALNYVGGSGGAAAVQFASGRTRVVTMGFPFETISTAANRAATMARVLDHFSLLTRGDLNNDGVVNNQDIAAFVQGLTDPNAFTSGFGYAPTLRGDVNADGVFNNQDIAPFVALLTGTAPRPAPTPSPSRDASLAWSPSMPFATTRSIAGVLADDADPPLLLKRDRG